MQRISPLLIFLFTLSACNSTDNNEIKRQPNNLAIFFHDNSLNKENPSIQLFIDNKPTFQSDSITKLKRQDFKISMDTGKHIVAVQTVDKQFATLDTIDIIKINQRYLLSISFNYNPPTIWYNDYLLKESYKSTLVKNKLKPDTIIKWLMDSLTNKIRQENKTTPSLYKPSDRHFEIEFMEQPILE